MFHPFRAFALGQQGARLALVHLELIQVGLQVGHLRLQLLLVLGQHLQKLLQLQAGVTRSE